MLLYFITVTVYVLVRYIVDQLSSLNVLKVKHIRVQHDLGRVIKQDTIRPVRKLVADAILAREIDIFQNEQFLQVLKSHSSCDFHLGLYLIRLFFLLFRRVLFLNL